MVLRIIRSLGLLTMVLILFIAGLADEDDRPFHTVYPDPERYASAIEEFLSEDEERFPPSGAVLCIGSSSMRGWHATLEEDFAPLTVIPRGFGGSTMYDVLYWAEKIVLPYEPRAILIYEGENDISAGVPPETIRDVFITFVDLVHSQLPETRIYFMSLKPSIRRWHLWDQMREANLLIARECSQNNLLTFYDISVAMLNDEGTPKPEIFLGDELHMNDLGYDIWRERIVPRLKEAELLYEKDAE